MANNIFPELEGWDAINSDGGTIGSGINKAIHRLVVAIANLRSATSAQLGYLTDKVEELHKSADQLNKSFVQLNENLKKADESSTKLATALNRLTRGGVIVASAGILLALIQFLFENKIWPFPR
ncbi:MAG: hypothetical protein US86_C0022G0007 [Candidatus Daviesbacteria bacterium GW2011_GWA2_38_24]|uniref:Uncharacterized protein n=1 Tax=Candidatus Daviesbacteria bacterium GW2011_GWA2_38_24 TaxID=1618422 RepID=A0A0G0LSL0_9BACT|nr:MAG: hypothetical protein US86_C0022G0007 [Candidatus Daviesbacteria bacterium GW2011_GWA2_38_24]